MRLAISSHQYSGPCNSVNYLGHSKNIIWWWWWGWWSKHSDSWI